jgi:hypothetical protein
MLQSASGSPQPRVTVVIPTLNEARNLPYVFSRLPPGLHEVIVVDGRSVDDTLAAARRLRADVRVIIQNRSGKGNALACGFAAATGDIIATIDADGSADPAEILQFVGVLLDGADFAKGTRFTEGGGSADITRLRRIGNRLLTSLVNALCRTQYSDLCYGFNAFWRYHVPVLGLDAELNTPAGSSVRLWGDGFEVETLINIRIARAGLVVKEVASYEYPRAYGASNLKIFSDGCRVLRTILAERHYSSTREADATSLIPNLPSAALKSSQHSFEGLTNSRSGSLFAHDTAKVKQPVKGPDESAWPVRWNSSPRAQGTSARLFRSPDCRRPDRVYSRPVVRRAEDSDGTRIYFFRAWPRYRH